MSENKELKKGNGQEPESSMRIIQSNTTRK